MSCRQIMMGMEPRSLTRMLAKLEERGYIYREPDKFDKRKVQIFLTPLGLEKKNRAKEVVIGFNKKLYNDFSDEDLDIFFHVLDSIHKILNTYDHASS
ncbi:MAG: MarR family transcriptional regulator [Bacteroidota bacterium]